MWRAKMANRNSSKDSREKEIRLPAAANLKEKILSLLPDRGGTIGKDQNIHRRPFLSWDDVLLAIIIFLSIGGLISIWGVFLR